MFQCFIVNSKGKEAPAKHQGRQGRSDREPVQIRNRDESAGFIL